MSRDENIVSDCVTAGVTVSQSVTFSHTTWITSDTFSSAIPEGKKKSQFAAA